MKWRKYFIVEELIIKKELKGEKALYFKLEIKRQSKNPWMHLTSHSDKSESESEEVSDSESSSSKDAWELELQPLEFFLRGVTLTRLDFLVEEREAIILSFAS